MNINCNWLCNVSFLNDNRPTGPITARSPYTSWKKLATRNHSYFVKIKSQVQKYQLHAEQSRILGINRNLAHNGCEIDFVMFEIKMSLEV